MLMVYIYHDFGNCLIFHINCDLESKYKAHRSIITFRAMLGPKFSVSCMNKHVNVSQNLRNNQRNQGLEKLEYMKVVKEDNVLTEHANLANSNGKKSALRTV